MAIICRSCKQNLQIFNRFSLPIFYITFCHLAFFWCIAPAAFNCCFSEFFFSPQKWQVIYQWSTGFGSDCCLATGKMKHSSIKWYYVFFFFLQCPWLLSFTHAAFHSSPYALNTAKQGCTDVLLKEHLVKVVQCFTAHSSLLKSQSTFISSYCIYLSFALPQSHIFGD